MKHTLLLFTISCLFVPATAMAQATKSIPLGRNWGIDTHIRSTGNMDAINAHIDRQIAQAQEQARAAQAERRQQLNDQDIRLEREDVSNGQDYVVTPEGNIKKHSWQACEYYQNWQSKQAALHVPLEQIRSQQEIVLLMLDLTEDYCTVLAQQYRLPNVSGVSVLPTTDVAALPQPDIPTVKQATLNAVPAEADAQAQTNVQTEHFSWRDVTQTQYVPSPISKHKAKRYLREFLKENKDELERALALQARHERMNPGLRRLLTSYDSLCSQYELSVGQPSPDCQRS